MTVNIKKPDGKQEPIITATKAQAPAPVGESDKILATITKEKGGGIVLTGSTIPDVERIPTGVFEFDDATGGGVPKGRLTIIYGPESSGKSNICYGVARNVQNLPGELTANKVVWVDLEGTFDPHWVSQFGVDLDKLVVIKPGYGEEAVDIIDALIRADDVGAIIVDSIAVMTAAREVEASTEKADVGTAAILVKRLCNKLAIAFSLESRRGHFPAVVFVNQTRFKVGVMFGDPETMPGGQTMKFLSSLTVRLYGKNEIAKEIHPSIAAYKDTNAVIKKAKVPVTAMSFTYKMVLIPQPDIGLLVGETASWGYVSGYLRSMNHIEKVTPGTGWRMFDQKFSTLLEAQNEYYTNPILKAKCQKVVIDHKKGKSFLVEADGPAAK